MILNRSQVLSILTCHLQSSTVCARRMALKQRQCNVPGCRLPAARGFQTCCLTCASTQGVEHGPKCIRANWRLVTRPATGDKVIVLDGPEIDELSRPYVGKQGVVIEDDGGEVPYRIKGMTGKNLWFHESLVAKVDVNALVLRLEDPDISIQASAEDALRMLGPEAAAQSLADFFSDAATAASASGGLWRAAMVFVSWAEELEGVEMALPACTLYFVFCTLYFVLSTVYCVLCTLYFVLCTLGISGVLRF